MAQHVLRVKCLSGLRVGSAFVHRSGLVVTAAHVIASCGTADLRLINFEGKATSVKKVKIDAERDLALLTPRQLFQAGLKISQSKKLAVGITLAIWGFPVGYAGNIPLLTVGYLSGISPEKKPHNRLFVNAAFNSGNSGGPVIETDSKKVVGVVVAKLAPIPQGIKSLLGELQRQTAGQTYTFTKRDGSQVQLTEPQVVARILNYLRSQTQLVLGTAVTSDAVLKFMQENGIDP